MILRVLCLLHMTGCEGRAKPCIHQRHCCCPSSSYCPSPFTSMHCCSAALCDQRREEGKRALAMQIIPHHHLLLPQEFLTLCCAQMLVLIHSALVKQHRFWITILLVFHFKYLFSRHQSSVKHLSSRSCGKSGKVSDRAGPAWHRQSQPLWVLGVRSPISLSLFARFLFCSLHFLLPLPLLASTDYNLNLLPGRDSLGNNTKSLYGELCDFITNFNHSHRYFSSWWKVEESNVTDRKSEEWLGGWRASNAGVTGTNHQILPCF